MCVVYVYAGAEVTAVHHGCCQGSCQNVHGSTFRQDMFVHPKVSPPGADTQVLADADADVKGLTLSANGETGAHQGARGPRVGVEGCGDRGGPQSCTTAQQVGTILNTLVSVAQSYHAMHLFEVAVVTHSESGVIMYQFDACKSVTSLQ